MSLQVDIRHRLGNFQLDALFASDGRLTALFGASGSGKTSVVRAIAGLFRPDQGAISVTDQTLSDTTSRIFTPPYRRRIGYVFQDARLFPHLTCRQNLNYGRWFTPTVERYADFGQVVELLGIEHLLDRRPAGLSGGEQQRVAIGRALAASPRLLLMDEPLASLDEDRKAEIMPYIERLRDVAKIPIVYVSHSIAEVARLADQVVVMADGRVSMSGPTTEVMLRSDLMPSSEKAEAGALLDMRVDEHDDAYGMTKLCSAAGGIRIGRIIRAVGERVRLRIRARDVMLSLRKPTQISSLNVLEGRVSALLPVGDNQVDVAINCNGETILARITRLSAERLALEAGVSVFAIIKSVSFEQTRGSVSA